MENFRSGDLRSNYTHDIPVEADWEGRTVGGKQRLSLMLRVSHCFIVCYCGN